MPSSTAGRDACRYASVFTIESCVRPSHFGREFRMFQMADGKPISEPAPNNSTLLWFVAHTKPRCEKKLFSQCDRDGIKATLPTYESVHKSRGKRVVFRKPLFPGYVFLHMPSQLRATIRQSDLVANLLDVHDQAELERQLKEILSALDAGLEVKLAPDIGEGMRVRIKVGALRGVEGWVEKRHGADTILLRLDFIGQAAAVKLGAEMLEPV
jgi:transcription antitermination factor NusG